MDDVVQAKTPLDRTRTFTWEDPLPTADASGRMAGIDVLQAIIDGALPAAPMAAALGFALSEVADGFAVFTMVPDEHHYNPNATVHGGLAATLIDSATGCAVHTTLPAGTGYTTTSLSVDFLRPINVETGPIGCEGRVVHRGSRLAIAEGQVLRESDDKVLVRGQTSCMIFVP